MTGFDLYGPHWNNADLDLFRRYSEDIGQVAAAEECLYVDLLDAYGDTDWMIHEDGVHANDLGFAVTLNIDPTAATVTGSLFEDNSAGEGFVEGAELTLETSVLRGSPLSAGAAGRGLSVQDSPDQVAATVAVRDSLLEQNRQTGFFVAGSGFVVESTVVRDTQPDAGITFLLDAGFGILQQTRANALTPILRRHEKIFEVRTID